MMPSASHWQRLAKCPAAAAYPWVDHAGQPAPESGIARHKFLRDAAVHGREFALAAVPPKYLAMCEAIDLSTLEVGPNAYRCEVAFAFNPVTLEARVLGEGLSRDVAYAACPDGWIPGTIDRVGLTEDSAVIRDFKGWWQDLPPVAENWQLRIYLLAATVLWDRAGGTLSIDRVGEDGRSWTEPPVAMDFTALAKFALELRGVAARVRAAMADPSSAVPAEGPHCAGCPALLACPAKVRAVTAISRSGGSPPPMTREDLAIAARLLPALKEYVGKVEAAIKAAAATAPLDGPDGLAYGPLPQESVADGDAEAALRAIRRKLTEMSPPPADEAAHGQWREMIDALAAKAVVMEPAVTASSVYELARAIAPRGQIKATAEDLRAAIRAEPGAVKYRHVYEWRPVAAYQARAPEEV